MYALILRHCGMDPEGALREVFAGTPDGRAYLAHLDRTPVWDLSTALLTHQLGTVVGIERAKLGLGPLCGGG
jgi:hypothetical protein